jgi:hypothetical protein
LAGRGSRKVRELTLDRFLPKIGPGAALPGADGEELGASPLQPRQDGDGASRRTGGDAAGLRRSRDGCPTGRTRVGQATRQAPSNHVGGRRMTELGQKEMTARAAQFLGDNFDEANDGKGLRRSTAR